MNSRSAMWVAGAIALMGFGCGSQTSQVAVAEAPTVDEQQANQQDAQYAEALGEAFSTYETEINTAVRLRYATSMEADVTSLSLSPNRFDWLLEAALGERGLTIEDMGAYANLNPQFFHHQQRLYWGRLDRLRLTAATIPELVVEGEPDQISMVDTE